MENIITQVITNMPMAAYPVVVTVLGLFYIYRKIGNERKETKNGRDEAQKLIEYRVEQLEKRVDTVDEKLSKIIDFLGDIKAELAAIKACKEKEK